MEPVVYTPANAVVNLRRSTAIGAMLAAVAIVITSVAGHPLMGVFGLLGILLGAFNNLLLQRSVVRRAQSGVSAKRFSGGVFTRLGAITLIAVGIALLVHPDGLGTFVGLAVFEVLMLVGAAVPVFRSLRPTS